MHTDSNSETSDNQSNGSSIQPQRYGPISPITTPANTTNNQLMTSMNEFPTSPMEFMNENNNDTAEGNSYSRSNLYLKDSSINNNNHPSDWSISSEGDQLHLFHFFSFTTNIQFQNYNRGVCDNIYFAT